MKIIKINLLIVLSLLCSNTLNAQVIQNGGFESGTTPTTISQLYKADFWEFGCLGTANLYDCNWTSSGGFPPLPGVPVPTGCVEARDNGAPNCRYASITTAVDPTNPDSRETIMNQLSGNLLADVDYSLVFYVARPGSSPQNKELEVVLRKSGDCNSEIIVPITTPIAGGNCNWVQVSTSFTLTPAQAAFGYDRIEIRDIYLAGYDDEQIFIDDVSLIQIEADLEADRGLPVTQEPSLYGPQDVYHYCGESLFFDGSGSNDETDYMVLLTEFDLVNWTGIGTQYSTGWISGQAPSTIDLNALFPTFNFQIGSIYMVSLAVGPVWDTDNVFFTIDGSTAEASFVNVEAIEIVSPTPWGPQEIPRICGRVRIDGSLSSCEDAYFISVAPFNPTTWSNSGPVMYSGWISGQAPNDIDLGLAPFNLSFSNGQFYIVQFAVGPQWDDRHLVFRYKSGPCRLPPDPKKISVHPNPTSTVLNIDNVEYSQLVVTDISGKEVLSSGYTRRLSVEGLRPGVYLLKLWSDELGAYMIERFVKE